MNGESWNTLLTFGFFVTMLFIAGLYCILVTRNLMRILIGLELLAKAATLLLIAVGYVTGKTELTQALVITVIVVEVVVAVVAGGIILRIYRHTGTLDVKHLRSLRG